MISDGEYIPDSEIIANHPTYPRPISPTEPVGRVIEYEHEQQRYYSERYDRGDGRDQYGRLLPGTTANPLGRPQRKYTLTSAIRRGLDPERFADSLLRDAYAGDNQARKMVLQYAEGLPVQIIRHQGIPQAQSVFVLPSNGHELQIPDQLTPQQQEVSEDSNKGYYTEEEMNGYADDI